LTYPTGRGSLLLFIKTGGSSQRFYLAAIALSVYEVFMRYVLDAPTSWTSETIMALVATGWLLSVGAVTQQRRHITVTTMELVLGDRLWRRLRKIAIAISIIGVTGLIIMLWDPMVKILNAPQTTGSAFDPPTPTYIKTLFVGAAFLYLLQLIANLFTPDEPSSEPQQSKN